MTEMVERLARVICKEHGFYSWEPDFTKDAEDRGNLTPEDYRDFARAALESLRIPTPEMLDAGNAAGSPESPALPHEVWPAMIDAARDGYINGFIGRNGDSRNAINSIGYWEIQRRRRPK